LDLEFSAEQEELRATVRRFLAERAPISYVRSMLDDDRGTSNEVWSGLARLGATGLLVPEEHGGAGMGMVDMAVVLEELGRAVHPGPFASSAVGAASLVLGAGGEDARASLLPGLASGERVGTVAVYEPGRRGDWAQPTTTARPGDAGWVLTGRKVHVPDAVAADLLLVTAAADGLAVFVVERDAPGLEVEAAPPVDGTRKRGALVLDDVPGRRLDRGDATATLAETIDRLAVAGVVDGVGAASRAMELAVEYARERRQFDRPIGSFQAVQHLCADMLRAVELARAAAYYACWAVDAAPARERHRAVTMARAFAADELYRVGASAIQVHGGIGFTWEHDVHLYYKRLLTLQHEGGGATDHLEELASLVLD
jgi:alkylation response protein AidB-like acyl-CoA dehydrogenase